MRVDNVRTLAKAFERYVVAVARGEGDAARTLAEAKFGIKHGGWPAYVELAVRANPRELISANQAELAGLVEKASVAVGTTADGQWAGPLVALQTIASGWMASLRNISALDAIAEFMLPAPAGTKLGVQAIATGAGSSVGEAVWKPLQTYDYSVVTAKPTKSLSCVVFSDDLLKFGSTFAENALNAALRNAVVTASDTNVFDTLLAGVSPIASTGDARVDLAALFAAVPFGQTSRPILFVSPNVNKQLCLIGERDGPPAFPDLSLVGGGSIGGVPTLPCDALYDLAGVSPSTGDSMVLVDAAQLAGDAGVLVVDLARDASLAMVDAASGAQSMISLFQTNSLALRAERWFTLSRPRAASVAMISNVGYNTGSP